MKNYFKFNLTGNKLFPVWILFMVLFLIPYIYVQFKLQDFKAVQTHDPHETMERLGSMFKWYGFMFFLIIIEYVILFFIAKLSIEAVEYKEKTFSFIGKFGQFLSVYIPGFLLSIITIGIYSPWFTANVMNFFAQKSTYNSNNLEFKSKGSDLFLIMLFTLIIPMLVLMFIIGAVVLILKMRGLLQQPASNPLSYVFAVLMLLLILAMVIPYMYYVYKWGVNFKFKNYNIQWETTFWSSALKIALEILLSMITLGIYTPLAVLKLYKYFAERTIAKSETSSKKFGYDMEPGSDFLFIWGQLLLGLVTLGIYYPWAYCKVSERVLSKTFSEEIEVA
jgi:uncharacterized membrane protein YjgN (DUF898 family)